MNILILLAELKCQTVGLNEVHEGRMNWASQQQEDYMIA